MTAVRRFTAGVCFMAATTLAAQTTATTKKTQTLMPTPAPKIVPVEPVPAQVQPTTEPVTAAVTADTDRDLTNPRAMRLSLDDSLRTAMERNIGIDIQRYDYLEAGQNLRGSYGVYDWLATGNIAYQNNKSPATSQFQPFGSKSIVADAAVSQVIPTGGDYSVTFNNSRSTTAGGGT